MKRLILAAAVASAVAASVVPASAAAGGCPRGFYARGTGIVSPLSNQEITYCYPDSP